MGAVHGRSKQELLGDHFDGTGGDYWQRRPLCGKIDEIAGGSFKWREPPAIRGTGYVVRSLEAALWAFHHGTDYADVVLTATNLGDDADTTAAIAGQLAGAIYGVQGIPEKWMMKLAMREVIDGFACRLCELAE